MQGRCSSFGLERYPYFSDTIPMRLAAASLNSCDGTFNALLLLTSASGLPDLDSQEVY